MVRADAVVVGAGIAGLSVAMMLRARGLSVLVVEREQSEAMRASGNPAGIISPYLRSPASSALHDKNADFFSPAFEFALQFFEQLPPGIFSRCGIVQLPSTNRLVRMVAEVRRGELTHPDVVVLDRAQVGEVSGVVVDSGALYHPRGGWIDPRALCRWLVSEKLGTNVLMSGVEIVSASGGEQGWSLLSKEGERFESKFVVFANAFECRALAPTAHLPLEAVRGTIASGSESVALGGLKCVLCHSGYIIPTGGNSLVFGTTYRHGVTHYEEDPGEVAELQSSLQRWVPNAAPTFSTVRICYRTSTRDRLPLVGELRDASGHAVPGAFTSVGHGSRGLVSAPYAGMLIADAICS
jgi:tRNA 5-methylaminomethyl-2-thiouridine biosynthesis bifunctional protein